MFTRSSAPESAGEIPEVNIIPEVPVGFATEPEQTHVLLPNKLNVITPDLTSVAEPIIIGNPAVDVVLAAPVVTYAPAPEYPEAETELDPT